MHTTSQRLARILASLTIFSSPTAYSGSIDTNRTDEQSLRSQTEWRDSYDRVLSSLNFSFDQPAHDSPSGDINSPFFHIKLGKFFGTSSKVEVLAPSNCKIGSTDIPDDNVLILIDGQPQKSGTFISMTKNTYYTVSMRFVGSDAHDVMTGLVSCNSGALRSKKGSAKLNLNVSGNIAEVTWEDDHGSPITFASLNFDGIFAGDPYSTRTSNPTLVSLRPSSTIGTFIAQVPSNCKIGTTPINPEHVYLSINGARVNSGEPIRLQEGLPFDIQLAFTGEGSYGDQAGTVTCASGQLIPEYKGIQPLELRVSGTIIDASQWQDADGRPIQSMEFNFVPMPDGQPDSDIDSLPLTFQLQTAPNPESQIFVQAPRYCRVGNEVIGDSYISVVIDNSPVGNGSTLSIEPNRLHEIKLRIKKDGLGSSPDGDLSCFAPGQMAYQYLTKSDENTVTLFATGYISTKKKSK